MQWFTRIVGLGLTLLFAVGLGWFQLTKLPNRAKSLPANTQAFSVVNTEAYSGQLPLGAQEKWATFAWVDNAWQPWEGRAEGAKLIDEVAYQNVRKRLRYNTDVFMYMEPAELDTLILPWMHEEAFASTGTWLSILQRIPAFGFTLDFWAPTQWYGESFVAVDKAQLNQGYFVRPDEVYRGELLAHAPMDAEILIGGMNAYDLWEQLSTHLEDFDESLAIELQKQLPEIPNGEFLLARQKGKWRFIHKGESGVLPDGVDTLLPGSDLFVRFQVENVDKASIMVSSGIKLFDDGIASRHLIEITGEEVQ